MFYSAFIFIAATLSMSAALAFVVFYVYRRNHPEYLSFSLLGFSLTLELAPGFIGDMGPEGQPPWILYSLYALSAYLAVRYLREKLQKPMMLMYRLNLGIQSLVFIFSLFMALPLFDTSTLVVSLTKYGFLIPGLLGCGTLVLFYLAAKYEQLPGPRRALIAGGVIWALAAVLESIQIRQGIFALGGVAFTAINAVINFRTLIFFNLPGAAIKINRGRDFLTASSGPNQDALIMIVEGENSSGRLERHLKRIGFDVQSVPSGEELILNLAKFQPDIVVTHYEQMKMSGTDIIRFIRRNEELRTLPIVVFTETFKEEVQREVREAGADHLIVRPIDDLELLAILRNLLSLKQKEKEFFREMTKARRIQENLLPLKIPPVPGLQIDARYEPMEMVGGDLYDFIILRDNRVGFFMADVSGHGISAAMIASMAKLVLSIIAIDLSSPAELLEYLNQYLYGKTAGNFLTCIYAVYDPNDRSFTLASAGHPPIIHIRNQKAQYLSYTGKAIGWLPEITFREHRLQLEQGDRILLYTDGLIEAFDKNKNLFGEERLEKLAIKSSNLPLNEQLNMILLSVNQFQEENYVRDDVTLVGIELE